MKSVYVIFKYVSIGHCKFFDEHTVAVNIVEKSWGFDEPDYSLTHAQEPPCEPNRVTEGSIFTFRYSCLIQGHFLAY